MAENEINNSELERKAALETLHASYQMYKNSINEMREVRSEKTDKYGNRVYSDESIRKTNQLMATMQKDIKNKYLALGGNEEDLEKPIKKGRSSKKAVLDGVKERNMSEDEKKKSLRYLKEAQKYAEVLNKYAEENKKQAEMVNGSIDELEKVSSPESYERHAEEEKAETVAPKVDERLLKPVATQEEKKETQQPQQNKSYDTVRLPSGGECYPNKMKEIKVAHLVAYDENMILSPNL